MKKLSILLLLIHLSLSNISGQIIWQENFDNTFTGCNPNSSPFTWTQVDVGTQGSHANQWYIYYPENSIGSIGCDTTNTDNSKGALYIGYGGGCDSALSGAKFRKGCDNLTNKRVESPIIDCTGHSSLVLSFDYAAKALHHEDYSAVLYRPDNSSTWDTLIPTLNSGRCYRVGGIKFWERATVNLPTSADNNPNVQIAFAWTNNDNCIGNSVSAAIDSIVISTNECNLVAEMYRTGEVFECTGPQKFIATLPVDSTNVTYLWLDNEVPIGSNRTIFSDFTSPGDHTIQLIVSNGSCTDTTEIDAFLFETPTVSITPSANPICLHDFVSFTSNITPSSPISGTYEYIWRLGSFYGSTTTVQPSYQFNDLNNHVTLNVRNSDALGGCATTAQLNLEIDLCGFPYVNQINSDVFFINLCTNSCITLHSNAVNATSYYWSVPDGTPTSSTESDPNICFNSTTYPNPSSITLTITNSLGTYVTGTSTIIIDCAERPILETTPWEKGNSKISISNISDYSNTTRFTWYFKNIETNNWDVLHEHDSTISIKNPGEYKIAISDSESKEKTTEETIIVDKY